MNTQLRRIGGHVSSAGSVVNALENAKKIDANCLQIFAGSPRTWARKLWGKSVTDKFVLKAQSDDLFPLFIHALYLVNLGSDNHELVRKSIDSLVIDLKNGQACQASGVIVHLGSYQTRSFIEALPGLIMHIQEILTNTETVPFVIENSAGQKGKIGSLEEIGEIFEALPDPRLKICLDSAHLFESGWDLRDQKVIERLVERLDQLGILHHLACLHLNDSKTKFDSRHDQHANLGEGEIGLAGLANLINHPKLSHLPILLEVPGQDKAGPDAANIQIARKLTLGV